MRARLLAILSVAALLRVAVLIDLLTNVRRAQTPDSAGYLAFGRHFATALEGKGIYTALTTSRTPGYPMFIALLGGNIPAVMVAQTALSIATVWLTYQIGRRLFSPTAGLVAAGIVSVDPGSIFLGPTILTETLATFLTAAGILLWVVGQQAHDDWRPFAFAGLAFGADALVRPLFLYLPLVFIVCGLIGRRRLIPVVVVVLAILPPAVWLVRNDHVAGGVVYSSVQADNLFNYRAASALASDQHVTLQAARVEMNRDYPPRTEESIAHRVSVEQSAAIKVLDAHLLGAAKTTAKGVGRMLVGSGWDEMQPVLGHAPWLIRKAAVVWSIGLAVVTFIAALAGMILAVRRRLRLAVLPLVVLGYMVLLSVGAEATARFRVPLMPLLAVFAGATLTARCHQAALE